MKKLISLILVLVCVLGLAGCNNSGKSHTIEIFIPAGSTEAFVYSDEEISPQKNTLKIKAGAGIATTEVILKPVEVCEENAYEPTILKQREPIKMDVEKGAWFKIGVAIQNPADVPIAAEVIVENVDIRIQEEITVPTGYPSGEIQQPQIMYNGQVYVYFATGFDEPLPNEYEYVGNIVLVDNENEPIEDFYGARVELKQEIYASKINVDTIYVKYENGYARFSIRK